MSKSCYWTPPPKELKEHYVSLKYEIGKYFDENYNGDSGSWIVGDDFIPFLKGIAAAGNGDQVKDAMSMIKAIQQYGTIHISIH